MQIDNSVIHNSMADRQNFDDAILGEQNMPTGRTAGSGGRGSLFRAQISADLEPVYIPNSPPYFNPYAPVERVLSQYNIAIESPVWAENMWSALELGRTNENLGIDNGTIIKTFIEANNILMSGGSTTKAVVDEIINARSRMSGRVSQKLIQTFNEHYFRNLVNILSR